MVRGALQGLPAPEVHTLKHGSHTGLEGHRTGQQGRCQADPGGSHKGWGCQDWRSISKLEGGPQKPQGAKEGQAGGPWEDAGTQAPQPVSRLCAQLLKPLGSGAATLAPSAIGQHLGALGSPARDLPLQETGVRGLAAIATMGVSSLIPPDRSNEIVSLMSFAFRDVNVDSFTILSSPMVYKV